MARMQLDSETLLVLSTHAGNAADRVAAARASFASRAAGLGAGFEDGKLNGQYEEAYHHALAMADNYLKLLQGWQHGLQAVAALYAQAESRAASGVGRA